MKKIIIYSSSICPYCIAAKKLLRTEGLCFEEKIIDGNQGLKELMIKKTNGKTSVPQIFFNEKLIGGYDQLLALHKSVSLKDMVKD